MFLLHFYHEKKTPHFVISMPIAPSCILYTFSRASHFIVFCGFLRENLSGWLGRAQLTSQPWSRIWTKLEKFHPLPLDMVVARRGSLLRVPFISPPPFPKAPFHLPALYYGPFSPSSLPFLLQKGPTPSSPF